MKVLVTGGAGYIGSHTIIELVKANHDVVIIDNFSNSSPGVITRVEKITGNSIPVERVDLCDKTNLAAVFKKFSFDAVIHFAGLKAVGESVHNPLLYYRNNLLSTINLCDLMYEHKISKLIFSSSATVYGNPDTVPIKETAPIRATNPYGQTKLIIEQILKDLVAASQNLQVICLRYFNPVGAHSSGLIGEDPNGIPNNLLPYVAQVAVGKLKKVNIFGDDYPTKDGTGVRDYIHVVDLAVGHVIALDSMPLTQNWEAINLGTGKGYSVFEVIKAFEIASGRPIPYAITERRSGDIASCYADPAKAKRVLGWKASRTLEDACLDTWNWQTQNPNGYS